MADNNHEIQNKFPIRELSARTQVNTVTLRAWERRYGLLKPKRTAKGHRLYSEEDVVTIERIVALVARGVPLRKVKPLLQDGSIVNGPSDESEDWSEVIAELIASIKLFSPSKVEHLLHEAFANYPTPICREYLIEPVFAELASRDDHAAMGFVESELIRYVTLRLSAKVSRKKGSVSVMLIAGTQAPIWHLAVMALDLNDVNFSVCLLNRVFSIEAGLQIARKLKDSYTVFYQDGVWKDKELQQVTTALLKNERLFMCGTASVLGQLDSNEQVFEDTNSCIDGLLKYTNKKGS